MHLTNAPKRRVTLAAARVTFAVFAFSAIGLWGCAKAPDAGSSASPSSALPASTTSGSGGSSGSPATGSPATGSTTGATVVTTAPISPTSTPQPYVENQSAPPSATVTGSIGADGRQTVFVTLVTYGADSKGTHGSGIVTGISESSGTCTLTATSGSNTVTGTIAAQPANASTNCGLINLQLPAGSWSLVLSYSSGSSVGQSNPVGVNVP